MVEIEQKYRIPVEGKEQIIAFLDRSFEKHEYNSLLDYRFSINKNLHGGKDFERVRFSKNSIGQIGILYSRKYTDENNVRQEIEREISKQEAKLITLDTSGVILKKDRYSWDHCLIEENNNISLSIDALEGVDFCYLELEVLQETGHQQECFLEMFNRYVMRNLKEFSPEIERETMLSMSKPFVCDKYNDLLGLV
jgi:hypothetical protein